MKEADIAFMEMKISDILSEYKEALNQTIDGLVSSVDEHPAKAVHTTIKALNCSCGWLEQKLYDILPSAPNEEESKAEPEEPKEQPKTTTGIKRPRKPKLEKLPEETKRQIAVAKHEYAVNTRLMPLGDIKRSMPNILKDVHPYSTVYNRFTEPLLKELEKEGIRTPASLANYSFSEVKRLVSKHSSWSVSNSCILAFADIYDIKFAPEKETLF